MVPGLVRRSSKPLLIKEPPAVRFAPPKRVMVPLLVMAPVTVNPGAQLTMVEPLFVKLPLIVPQPRRDPIAFTITSLAMVPPVSCSVA